MGEQPLKPPTWEGGAEAEGQGANKSGGHMPEMETSVSVCGDQGARGVGGILGGEAGD